jgi:hypothetical protein
MWSMDSAPPGRKLTVVATRMVPGLGPIEEPLFHAMAQFYSEHGYWAAENRTLNGDLELVPLDVHGWIC